MSCYAAMADCMCSGIVILKAFSKCGCFSVSLLFTNGNILFSFHEPIIVGDAITRV